MCHATSPHRLGHGAGQGSSQRRLISTPLAGPYFNRTFRGTPGLWDQSLIFRAQMGAILRLRFALMSYVPAVRQVAWARPSGREAFRRPGPYQLAGHAESAIDHG